MTDGRVIADRYELTVPLGRGGMGQVWEAYDRRLDRRVAVKLLNRDLLSDSGDGDEVGEKRFRRESQATARVEHPGVPAVYDVGSHEDTLYLAMQFVEGHLLGDVIAEEAPLPVSWAAAIAAQLASILSAAHERALVHRDLKPSNVILCPDGSVKLLDFGIAAVLDAKTRLTRGATPGTPLYMAPEQIEDRPATPRSDLYALGCLLHELLTGEPPFTGTLPSVTYQHVHTAPEPLDALRDDVPEALTGLVAELLAKRPEDRPADAREVYGRLVPLLPAPSGTTEPGGYDPTRPYREPMAPPPVRTAPRQRDGAVRSRPRGDSRERIDVAALRAEAERLRAAERYTQAGDVLDRLLDGADDLPENERLGLMWRRAGLAMSARDHRDALRRYRALLPRAVDHFGEGSEPVVDCRRQIVDCLALLGQFTDAADELRTLYRDHYAAQPYDREALEVGRRIGAILAAARHHEQAERWLRGQADRAAEALGLDDNLSRGIIADWIRVRDALEETPRD
ncbi:serine/threonine protein kinase [Thermobifida halotolerans]|uniref:non-specific serine/threonine protein kinase n=1 Tax=Thermobifida halotolerans TaxID=483545 RepID=A0AA97M3U3_9ACTN|nr:serine/threonine-protein kinase [Thermobifida halotolerans]UOE19330.1 serine/threonine protein kinase [Thermobifida halotolerans]